MGIKRWYGLIGLLSLLGFVGVFTGERYFLGFFAFAVDFQYFLPVHLPLQVQYHL